MPDKIKIPVFPLPIVVFPDEEIRLHIFEKRYKQLVQDCVDSGIGFGILSVIENHVMNIGTFVKLIEISKSYDDGKSDIRLQSLGLFKVLEYHANFPNKLYSAADVEHFEFNIRGEKESQEKVKNLFTELCEINNVKQGRSINWLQFNSFDLGHYVGFSLEEEYRFLSTESENERLNKLIHQIEYMISQSKLREQWLKRINMNGEFQVFGTSE